MASDVVIKCAENIQHSRALTKFGYSRQCTKCIPYFLNCKVSECQYPNFGYYDISRDLSPRLESLSVVDEGGLKRNSSGV